MNRILLTILIIVLNLSTVSITTAFENLNRGMVALKTPEGVFVSWRFLPADKPDTVFTLLRDGKPIASLDSRQGTNYQDKSGTNRSAYQVASNGQTSKPVSVCSDGFMKINLDLPKPQIMPDGTQCTYTPNDMSVGDLNGDGEYELVVKWDPSNSHDNSQRGYTGTTIFDAYELNGKKLWRIDLGINIRSGAHYSPFLVYDFDGDGKAEFICKTADQTTDSAGRVIGNSTADYRNKNGYVLDGPEFLTVFNGQTGQIISTIDYPFPRSVQKLAKKDGWGDNYGGRCDRFLAGVAYLDGKHPSAIFCRGYYTAAYLATLDFDGKSLKVRWTHRSETPGKELYGQGNHSLAVGDLDGDGKDEIVYGAAAVDDNGTLLYRTGFGHGDALHLFGTVVDKKPQLLLWDVHEEKNSPYGAELRAPNGTVLWGHPGGKDIGRGMAADIDSHSPGYELWSSAQPGIYSQTGGKISEQKASVNFRIYWDGDKLDELLDGTKLDKFVDGKIVRLESFHQINNSHSINSTKANPNLQADILGDWREEVIFYNESNPAQVNLFSTTIPSQFRIPCLMSDRGYRLSIAWQNAGYNQPPHLGYYLLAK